MSLDSIDPQGHQVLGWYSYDGVLYITHDLVSDPQLLTEVRDHELTHHIMISTTPFGLVQRSLKVLDHTWEADLKSWVGQSLRALADSSRFVQEGIATFSALASYSSEQRKSALERHTRFYVEAHDFFERLLSAYEADWISRVRLARAIAGRALETPILTQLRPSDFLDSTKLEAHLAVPEHRPDKRLEMLGRVLQEMEIMDVEAWAGRHYRTATGAIRVRPKVARSLGGLSFHPMPDPTEVATYVASFLDLDGERHESDVEVALARTESVTVSIQPNPGITKDWPDGTLDLEWLKGVDFVRIDRNVFDSRSRQEGPLGELELSAREALLTFYRPDYSATRNTRTGVESVGEALALADPGEQMTVCVMGLSLLPIEKGKGADSTLDEEILHMHEGLKSWVKSRPLVLYAGGTALGVSTSLIMGRSKRGQSWLSCSIRGGETWGYILLRPKEQPYPVIAHCTLIEEWSQELPGFLRANPEVELNTPYSEFFIDRTHIKKVLPFMRCFEGGAVRSLELQREIDDAICDALLDVTEMVIYKFREHGRFEDDPSSD